jgi:hypothetical protein
MAKTRAKTTKTKPAKDPDDGLSIPEFLRRKPGERRVASRQQQTTSATVVAPPTARSGPSEPEDAPALRAWWGHQLPTSGVDWHVLRQLRAEAEYEREQKAELRAAAREDQVPLTDVAERAGCSVRDARRALRRDQSLLPPDVRRMCRKFPRLAKSRRFRPEDVPTIVEIVRAGLQILRSGASATGGERRPKLRADGSVSFRDVVLDLRRERAEWRGLTRKKVAPLVSDRWPRLMEEQRVAASDVEPLRAAVRAALGRPASGSGK